MDGDCHTFNIPNIYARNGLRKINCETDSLLWTIYVDHILNNHDPNFPIDKNHVKNYPKYKKYQDALERFIEKHKIGNLDEGAAGFSLIEDNVPDIALNVYETDYTEYCLNKDVLLPKYITPIYQTKYPNSEDRRELNILKIYDGEWDIEHNTTIISNILSRLNIDPRAGESIEKSVRPYMYLCIESMEKLNKIVQVRCDERSEEQSCVATEQ